MTLLLVRLLISAAMFAAPFALLAFAGKSELSGMWLLFPLFAAVPGVLGALLLFVPVESALDARGLQAYKNLAVPAAGALIAPILMVVMATAGGKADVMLGRFASQGVNAWGPLVLWMVVGAIFGWRWSVTAWLAALIGMPNA